MVEIRKFTGGTGAYFYRLGDYLRRSGVKGAPRQLSEHSVFDFVQAVENGLPVAA